jgi:hypothetical protein
MGGAVSEARRSDRASEADRERVAAQLREACVEDRLSLESFVGRLENVFAARTRAELEPLLADLHTPGSLSRAVYASLSRTSLWLRQAREAWARPAIPLVLPQGGHAVVGRSRLCDVVLANEYVSRRHALLHRAESGWLLEDCGSRNGTWVNGRRVTSTAAVRPGDIVTLADARYVLTRPS